MLRSGECGEEPYISPFQAIIRVVLDILFLRKYNIVPIQLKTSRISSLS